MKKLFQRFGFAFLVSLVLPQFSSAAPGSDSPLGPAGEYNGSITTGGSYDPYTGNANRVIDDLTVTNSLGAYPLKWTRFLNTRNPGPWTHNYQWGLWVKPWAYYHQYPELYEGPGGQVTYPDGRILTLELADQPNAYGNASDTSEVQDRIAYVGNGDFDLLLRDGGRVKFQHVGNISGGNAYWLIATQIVDPYGLITYLTRDGSGRLSRITQPGGRYLQINYTNGYWTSVQAFSAEGQLTETVSYVWQNNNLTQVNYDDGTQAEYTYGPTNFPEIQALLIRTCKDVRFAGPMKNIEYEYTAQSGGNTVSFGQIKREKNATTHQIVSEVTYPGNPGVPIPDSYFQRTETRGDGKTRLFQYSNDGRGTLKSYTDFKGQTTQIIYPITQYPWLTYGTGETDARGNSSWRERDTNTGALMRVVHPDGSAVSMTYFEPSNPYYVATTTNERGYTTSHQRDSNHRITRTDYPDGSFETFTYNAFNQVLTHQLTSGGTETFGYDYETAGMPQRGLKTRQTDAMGNTTTFQYYTSGANTDRLLGVQDPRGNSTWFEYNQRGQVTKVTHQDGTYTQSAYNDDGTLAWSADELGHTTSYTYDEYKRVLTVTNPTGATTTNYYGLDWANPLVQTTTNPKYTLSPLGKNVVYEYDENFRKTYQGVALGTPDGAASFFEYDEVGNLTKTTDPRGNQTSFGYDNRNRQIAVTNALNQTTQFEYDAMGNKKKEIRADTAFRSWEYDAMNRLSQTVDWRMSTAESPIITAYGRNSTSTVETITDPKQSVYTFQFDVMHRKIAETYPADTAGATRSETWSYDAAGNVISYTNRAGATKQFAGYDNRNRPTAFSWNDGTQGQSFEYDAASRVTELHNAEADISFGYDAANRKTSETETIKSYGLNQTHTVTYEYDADGNRSRFVYPTGWDYRLAYTNRNQLASVGLAGSGTPSVAYTYDVGGNRSRRTIYYGAYTDYSYNAINQLSSQTSYFNGSTARFDYGFDAANRIKYEQRDSGVADGFSFDPRNELTGFNQNGTLNGNGTVSAAYNVSISYDANGNRIDALDGNVAHYNTVPNNQYSSDWTGALAYDGNANLTTRAGWTFTYDAQNRLTSIDSGSTHLHQHYDPLNRIVAWDTNGVITTQLWDNWNLIEEHDANDSFQRMYYHGPVVNEIVGSYGPAYGDAFYFQDGRGNVTHMTDPWNNVIEHYTYFVSGQPNYLSGSAMNNRFLFEGAIYLPAAGIYDMRNRFYLPNLGRFMQSDPIGFDAGDINLFRYCGNDPVDGSDPMGLDAFSYNEEYNYFRQSPYLNRSFLDGSYVNVRSNPRLNQECAKGGQFMAGTMLRNGIHGVPTTHNAETGKPQWFQGPKIGSTTNGLLVARGFINGVYPSLSPQQTRERYGPKQPINHVGVQTAYDKKTGIATIFDQAKGKPLGYTHVNTKKEDWHVVLVPKDAGDYQTISHDLVPTAQQAEPANSSKSPADAYAGEGEGVHPRGRP